MGPFAALLNRHVERSGRKQVAIASDAGITYNYLHLLLVEKRNPSEQVVGALADALQLTGTQKGELLSSAGYAPAATLLPTPPASPLEEALLSSQHLTPAHRLAQRCYRLTQEIPDALQPAFLEEIGHLFDYVRYKYVLCKGLGLADLRISSANDRDTSWLSIDVTRSLDQIATIVGELYAEEEEEPEHAKSSPHPSQIEDLLSAIDELTGSILSGEPVSLGRHPHLVEQIESVLRQGVPWEIRRRIVEALPGLCQMDAAGALRVFTLLRLDCDERYGVDIRRRVIEALPSLFQTDTAFLPHIVAQLQSQPGDDIFVALAIMEVCGDLQTSMKQEQKRGLVPGETALGSLLSPEQADLVKIQRQLLINWEGTDLECLQFSLALYDLLCAPETMLLSLQEGLQSPEKRLQLVAVRYLERLLPLRPAEVLQTYAYVLEQADSRNVRRTVARALPAILRCMNESSLPIRTLARSVIVGLARDSDIHIRRTVADYAMRIFHIDREFLLTILRHLHQDRDQAIRHRLHPVAMHLAELWFRWYAETAGLVRTTRRRTTAPFGE